MPGFFLRTQEEGAAIIAAIGSDRVGLQFDIYHCQVAQGDVTRRMEALMPVIAHMQLADVPGRNEPGTGEIAWDYVLGRIDELGYSGWIGCEYRPSTETTASLYWIKRFMRRRRGDVFAFPGSGSLGAARGTSDKRLAGDDARGLPPASLDEFMKFKASCSLDLGPIRAWKVGAPRPDAEPACAAIAAPTLFEFGVQLDAAMFNLIGVEAELAYRITRDLPVAMKVYSLDEVGRCHRLGASRD